MSTVSNKLGDRTSLLFTFYFLECGKSPDSFVNKYDMVKEEKVK